LTMGVLAVAPPNDVDTWARGSGLEIVLFVLGAVLLARFVRWLSTRITDRIDTSEADTDELVRSEASKHRHALAQVLTWTVLVLIYSTMAVLVLQRIGIPLSGFVAPAAVAGVALGFGAQRVVQDLLAGFFLVAERQYGFGDLIRISVAGVSPPVSGTVEDLSLRITRLRSVDGEVVITPNGQIAQVTNLSRDWARAVIDVPIPVTADVNRVTEVLKQIGAAVFDDNEMRPLLLDPPTVMGVESIEMDQLKIRVIARTLPGKQFDVGRALRARITQALRHEGIHLQTSLDTAGPSRTI
jgi:moderate conductance mechanosensitive channel